MRKIETPIQGAFLIEPEVYGDERGFFYESYNAEKFVALGIHDEMKQGNHSKSAKGVLRGMHYQYAPKAVSKLVRCTKGRIWDAIVDMRQDSPTYKQWFGVELSEENKKMLYVPAGCAHGFYCLEDSEFQYLLGHNVYSKELDGRFSWDDPEIGIQWPLQGPPTLSERDQERVSFASVVDRVNAKPPKVMITGAQGSLGTALCKEFESAGYEVLATDRDTLDITKQPEVFTYITEHRPDLVINAAANNLVDDIESPEMYPKAYAVNAQGPGYLAQSAAAIGVPFVHYSTEYVFDGQRPMGYAENDVPNPLSKYAETKAAGERAVQQAGGQYYIFRVSKLFGPPGTSEHVKTSFVDLMLRLAEEKPQLQLVHEGKGNPTYTPHIARRTREMLTRGLTPGVYHMVSDGPAVTPYEFAEEIFAVAGVDPVREPVSADVFPTAAERPKFAGLINNNLPPMPSRLSALREYLSGRS